MMSLSRKQAAPLFAIGGALVALMVGWLALGGGASAAEPEWNNPTAPGILVFEVNVDYNDGGGMQNESDVAEVTVIQVRAWELVHDAYPDPAVYKRPGSETEFHATIYNLGNYEDTFELDYVWNNGEDWVKGSLPQGWSVTIEPAGPLTIQAGESEHVTVIVAADEDVEDGDQIQVRLVVTTPETEPEIAGLEDLPTLAEKSDGTAAMVVRIVEHLLTFELTPDGDGEVEPRETIRISGEITNPSWAGVPVDEGTSLEVTIEIPEHFTLDPDSLVEWANDPAVQEYGCSAEVADGRITITCTEYFPGEEDEEGPGVLPIFFDVTVDPYTPPSDDETSYLFEGELEYEDISGAEHTIPAEAAGIDGKTPEVIVLVQRLVRIYRTEDGEFDPGDLEETIVSNPGKSESVTLWVRNEGNVSDTYVLHLESLFDKFDWSIVCADGADVGSLDPAAQRECTVSVTFPAGTGDEEVADVITLLVESVDEEILSNELEVTVDIKAPTIEVSISVWEDEDHSAPAVQVKPGDRVYIKIVVENKGRQDATDFTITHVVPDAIGLDGVVSVRSDVSMPAANVSGNTITLGPTSLPSGKQVTIIYSGVVK